MDGHGLELLLHPEAVQLWGHERFIEELPRARTHDEGHPVGLRLAFEA